MNVATEFGNISVYTSAAAARQHTQNISELLGAHEDGLVSLAPQANTTHESAKSWYDSYGAHISTENHGNISIQAVEYDWLDDEHDAAVVALVLADMPDPEDDDDAADLRSVAEGLVDRAREVRDAADTVKSLLDEAVRAYESADINAVVEALQAASQYESEHGDDPATQTLIYALCLISEAE